MENKGTFIDSDYQIVSRMSLNLLDISGLRSWSLAFIIAGLVHILYFSLLQFQNRIDQITQDGYSTIPIKIVSTHSKTVQPEVIAPEIIPAVRSKSELPNKTIQTSRVSKEFAPTSQITQKTKILPHPIAQPVIEKIDTLSKVPALTANITSTSEEIDVIKEQSEIPSRWALSDEQLNASLLDARGRPKFWQFEPDANYHRRICEGKIKSIDLSQDRKAEPCKKNQFHFQGELVKAAPVLQLIEYYQQVTLTI